MCGLSDNIYEYHFVSQGKTTIPSMDDGEEMAATDVRSFVVWKDEGVMRDKHTAPYRKREKSTICTDSLLELCARCETLYLFPITRPVFPHLHLPICHLKIGKNREKKRYSYLLNFAYSTS